MQKIIFYSFLIGCLIKSNSVFSQTKYEEVVYLKNGSVLRGIIVEFIPDQSIKIQTKDGSVFSYRIDEIQKITREPFNLDKITINNKQIKQSGFTNTTDISMGIGADNQDRTSWGLQTINGYLFNPYFSMGIGVGIEKFDDIVTIPAFIDIHTYFSNSIVAPFFSINIGKAFGTDDNKGGPFLNPSLGVKAYFTSKFAVDISIGYKMQEYEYESNSYSYNYSYSHEFLTFKTGVTF